jgi:hypothetical protein
MRVEARHRDAWRGDTEAMPQIAGHDSGSLDDQVDGQRRRHLPERDVDCDRYDGKTSLHSIMTGRGAASPGSAASAARYSVWPGYAKPAA